MISELASFTDETFAYLPIENYWDTWSTMDLEKYKEDTTRFDIKTIRK